MIFHEKFEIVFSNAQNSLGQRQVQPQDVSQSVLAISNWLKDDMFETYFNDCIKSSIDEGLSLNSSWLF